MFALVDCNNFYASCETLFRPDLRGRPVIVLSNNDGCVVARSPEAKALGIKMSAPYFEFAPLIRKAGVVVFSSNYTLYADMSARVMSTLEELVPEVEVYSIDEAFLGLDGLPRETLLPLGVEIRERIQKWQGLTVCVGMAPTKTLAKLANYAAKRWRATGGVVFLDERERQQRLMALLPVDEVWGVGRKLTRRLNTMGIYTVLDLARAEPREMGKQFSVVLERTIRELNGESCLPLEEAAQPRQQIVCSRSFGERVTEKEALRQAIANHCWRACEKLRQELLACRGLTLFVRTSHFSTGEPHYGSSACGQFEVPTADARDLMALARRLLDRIWRPGYRYAKCGVMLHDLQAPGSAQGDLFSQQRDPAVMAVVDSINGYAKGKAWLAGQGTRPEPGAGMKRQYLSPAYTTQWDQLPRVI